MPTHKPTQNLPWAHTHIIHRLPKTPRWLLPPCVVVLIGFLGIFLYLGGLGSPTDHLKNLPIAIVNNDQGATISTADGHTQKVTMGQEVTDSLIQKINNGGQFSIQELSANQAEQHIQDGEIYAFISIPEDFSQRTTELTSAALGSQGNGTRPTIDLVTSPQAGSMSSRLVTEAMTPALHTSSTNVGAQLLEKAEQQQKAAEDAQQPTAPLTPVAQGVLADPVNINTRAWSELPDGTALGMAPFYWAVILMMVGLTGSVAVHTLVDGILGVMPVEMGSDFRISALTPLPRFTTFLIKWGVMVSAGAVASAAIMLAASLVHMPMPHGALLWLVSWLSISSISAVALALITAGGSAGLILSMIYIVFLGLPSAGAVVPIEALPDFFAQIAKVEPLHYSWLAVRDVLFFDADANAGLASGAMGLVVILVMAVVLAAVFGLWWDRKSDHRGVNIYG